MGRLHTHNHGKSHSIRPIDPKKPDWITQSTTEIEEMIVKYGGTPVIWKTGHSLIKEKMRQNNVRFAGEMSGHIFFADDYYGYDDAIYVGLRAAQTLSRTDKKLSELTAEIPKYFSTPEMRLDCPTDAEKFIISDKAVKYFTENFDCETIDGVRNNNFSSRTAGCGSVSERGSKNFTRKVCAHIFFS